MGKRCIADPGHESKWTAAARPEMTASVVVGAAGSHSHRVAVMDCRDSRTLCAERGHLGRNSQAIGVKSQPACR
jgi:hypothetical protein